MRIKENGIMFRNEFNLLSPKETLIWLFGGDYIYGYRFKVDGIKIDNSSDFYKLNKFQLEKVENFYKKYKDSLPCGLNNIIIYQLEIKPEENKK